MTEDKKTLNVHVDPPAIGAPSMGVQLGPDQEHLKDEKKPAEHDQPVIGGPEKR
jgi:hypothetical protein